MRADFAAAQLRCPTCGSDFGLRVHAEVSDSREVRDGVLRCSVCSAEYPVHRGVAELLIEPPEHVRAEAAGLQRFAEMMRATGWDPERVRRLPYDQDGYWYIQAVTAEYLLTRLDFTPGAWLLDLGSNTCWASNLFAARGLNVVALDIALWELQGLYTADYFIQDGTSYFERVLGSMNEIPLASDSLDYIWACQVLHHNDAQGLRCTFEEAFRVLRPGGVMLVVNETLKTARDPVGVHIDEVAQFNGYEHAHWAARYRWEAVRAGFSTELLEPVYHRWFERPEPRQIRKLDWRGQLERRARDRRLVRKGRLIWVNHVAGDAQFAMLAVKPSAARRRQPASLSGWVRGPRQRAARSG